MSENLRGDFFDSHCSDRGPQTRHKVPGPQIFHFNHCVGLFSELFMGSLDMVGLDGCLYTGLDLGGLETFSVETLVVYSRRMFLAKVVAAYVVCCHRVEIVTSVM